MFISCKFYKLFYVIIFYNYVCKYITASFNSNLFLVYSVFLLFFTVVTEYSEIAIYIYQYLFWPKLHFFLLTRITNINVLVLEIAMHYREWDFQYEKCMKHVIMKVTVLIKFGICYQFSDSQAVNEMWIYYGFLVFQINFWKYTETERRLIWYLWYNLSYKEIQPAKIVFYLKTS